MNVFKFLSVHAGETSLLQIGKPVKKFMVNTAMTLLEDKLESPAELYDLKPGVAYEIPNYYGYPGQFNIKNKSESSITPKIYVLEFGDVLRTGQPSPPPPPPPVVELDYIVADKLVKEYEVGDIVNYDDITVIAHYTNGSTKDVTSDATIGTISTETAGDKTLSICYGEDDVEECTGINIEVIEPEPPEPVRHDIIPECVPGKRIGSDLKIAVHSGDALSYWPVSAGVTYYYDSYNANRMGFFLDIVNGSLQQVNLRNTTTYTPESDGYIVLTDNSATCCDLHAYYYE